MSVVSRLINTIYDYARDNGGSMLPVLIATHEEFLAVMETYKAGSGHVWVDERKTLKLMGVPLVIVPFEGDPLYKKLQAMAKLCSAEITFPDAQFNTPMEPHLAEFMKDGVGYRFIWGKHTLGGQSFLVPISTCFMSGMIIPRPILWGDRSPQ